MSSEEQDWNYRGNYGQPVDPLPQVTLAIGHHNSGNPNHGPLPITSINISDNFQSLADGLSWPLAIGTEPRIPFVTCCTPSPASVHTTWPYKYGLGNRTWF